jgi:hypothetical protein
MNFRIDIGIPSGNQVKRMHWAVSKKMREDFEWAIIRAVGRGPDMARIVGVRIYSNRARLLDPDRLYEGATLLIDALRHTGWIYRDSPAWLRLEIFQIVDRKNMGTEIMIQEIEKGGRR